MITRSIITTSFFCHDPLCSQVLIQYGHLHWLKGTDIVHYFNDKRVIPPWVFNYLLACIRHDAIMHKIDASSFRILISVDFYVSPIPPIQLHNIYLVQHALLIALLNGAAIYHLHTKKQSRLFIDPDAVLQVEFDFTIIVLKESLKDYDIPQAKLVNSPTHHIN
jgi:hypothetical protein